MKVLGFDSANIDSTYHVNHFVDAMETISADKMESFSGGKGFNQTIAFARAGSDVYFAGAVGSDGKMLVDTLKKEGVNIKHLKETDEPSGHAFSRSGASQSIPTFDGVEKMYNSKLTGFSYSL